VLFDKFIIESNNSVLVLHPKDRFGSGEFVVAFIAIQFSTNLAFLPQLDHKFSDFGLENLQPYLHVM